MPIRRPKRQLARPTSQQVDIPVPVGGLNTRDNLSTMPITDCIELVNWLPEQFGLRSRNGQADFASALSDEVETLLPYQNGATKVFLAFSDDDIQQVTTGGVVSSLATGLSNARWDGAQLGANMLLCNGQDAIRNFNGSTITTPSITGDLASYGTNLVDGVYKFKNRIFFWDTDNSSFWYGAASAVAGNFTEFPLGDVANTNGNIVEIKSLSRDGGDGVDDFACFILDSGEVIIYQGTDPGTAANWTLVGKYMIPPIIAKNCAVEYAGDVLVLTRNDLIAISDVMKYTGEGGGFNVNPSKLAGAIQNAFNTYGSNYGFSITLYPKKGWIILNIPQVTNASYVQYVVATTTGQPTKFEGWNANTFGVLDNNLYFGGDTVIQQADTGADDDGSAITLKSQQAFTNFGSGINKKVHNVRLYYSSATTLNVQVGVAFDYQLANLSASQSSVIEGSAWNVAAWDTSDWSGQVAREFIYTILGYGSTISLKTEISIKGDTVTWNGIRYNFDIGKTF